MLKAMAVLALASMLAVPSMSENPTDEPSLGSAAISVGDANLVISATETEKSPDGASPGSPGTPDAPPPCVPDPVRTTSCGISAERVTNDDGVPLTITDVAQFAPAPVTTVGEPGNVGVAGLPMNFVASASVQTRSGTLLGRPVSVRFSPLVSSSPMGMGARRPQQAAARRGPHSGRRRSPRRRRAIPIAHAEPSSPTSRRTTRQRSTSVEAGSRWPANSPSRVPRSGSVSMRPTPLSSLAPVPSNPAPRGVERQDSPLSAPCVGPPCQTVVRDRSTDAARHRQPLFPCVLRCPRQGDGTRRLPDQCRSRSPRHHRQARHPLRAHT